jgi:DNA-binding CsgD family transcriptional regulator/PAS domain-containing protein
MTSGRETKQKKLSLLLSIIPLITTVISWTNPWHGLLWERTEFRAIGTYTVNVVLEYGPWFWVHASYSYVLYIAGIVLIVREFFSHQSLFRIQAMCVLAGVILPFLINLLYVFRILENRVKDFTPIEIALSGIFFYIGVRKYGLATIRQIPRDQVYKKYADPVLVIDPQERIVDWNEQLFQVFPTKPRIGQMIAEFIPGFDGDALNTHDTEPVFLSVSVPEGELVHHVNARVQPLVFSAEGTISGWCITFFSQIQSTDPSLTLSRQEHKVLALVAEDLSNKEIAVKLGIGESTVKTHVHNLLKKTGATKRAELKEFTE